MYKLLLGRCCNGACISARTAGNALVSVDYVLAVALSDASNGARVSASAAGDALIRNFVSHLNLPP